MANKFATKELLLNRESLSATGDVLYVNQVPIIHNTRPDLQGGAPNEYFHISGQLSSGFNQHHLTGNWTTDTTPTNPNDIITKQYLEQTIVSGSTYYDGSNSAIIKTDSYFNDFDEYPVLDPAKSLLAGKFLVDGDGKYGAGNGEPKHYGIYYLDADANGHEVQMGDCPTSLITGAGKLTCVWLFKVSNTGTPTNRMIIECGFGRCDTARNLETTDSPGYFYYDNLNYGNAWTIRTSALNTRTISGTNVNLVPDMWYAMKNVVRANGVSEFYINDTGIATLNTNIPTGNFGHRIRIAKTAGGEGRVLSIDYFYRSNEAVGNRY